MSLPLSRVTLFILLINSNHSWSFSSAKALLKEIVVLITHHTCYHGMWVGTMLKMDGNCCLNGVLPTHVSFQNLI
jgi:hypothetical protein